MALFAVSAAPLVTQIAQQTADAHQFHRDIWLFGGGEPLCSSVEQQFCVPEKLAEAEAYFKQTEAFRAKRFALSSPAVANLQQFQHWPAAESKLAAVLQHIAKQHASLQLGAPAPAEFDETAWYQLWQPLELTDDEQNLLDDIFEVRQLKRDGSPKTMQVYFAGHQPDVQHMFRDFIAAARHHSGLAEPIRPKLLLITASSHDPFQWVDYYLQHFNAAGADATWLPIEPAMTALLADTTITEPCRQLNHQRFVQNGQYNRAAHYPELAAYQQALCHQPERMAMMIQQADAIFINGGDQSLTLRSLQLPSGEWTPESKLLLAKINQGTPLAGSSAGTAVQSGHSSYAIPMITGGSSRQAWLVGTLNDEANSPLCYFHQRCTAKATGQLTYRAAGGFGTFSLGVVDTHFRERNREGRLLKLLLDTKTAFGFGVDEATVLRAQFDSENTANLSVAGAGGVWIVDTRKVTTQSVQSTVPLSSDTEGDQRGQVTATRLLAGDTASFSLRSPEDKGLSAIQLHCDRDNQMQSSSALQPDLNIYQADLAVKWLVGSTAHACQRADGRWRYSHLPLSAQPISPQHSLQR